MKRAVIYARVSKQREESVSIQAQIEQCTARAEKLGAQVLQVFIDDGISGREASNRHDFQRAKAYCEAANVEYFITWSTSRFARNLMELFRSEAELREIGTRLECLNADIDDDTDAGFISKVFNGAMDEMYSRQVARDTLRSQKKSAAQGYFTGGTVPFGYQPVKEGQKTRLAPDPDAAHVVLKAFELFLQGGLGVQAIAVALNASGMQRNGKPWGKNTVNYLLKNEVYTGMKTFNKTHRKSRKTKPREEWIQVASHPALVSREDFERVQAMMEQRTPHQAHGGTPLSTFLFTGLAECGICSEGLQISNGTGRNGTRYSYYGCMGHKKGAPRCLFRKLRADLLDEWLLGEILDRVITQPVMVQAMEDLAGAGAQWARDREVKRSAIVKSIREIEGRREKLFELLETGGKDTTDLAMVAQRLRQRSAELEQLQKDLIALEAAPTPARVRKIDPAVAVEVMREVIAAADTKKKRAFLGAFIERVVLGVETVTVEYRGEALLEAGSTTSVHSVNRWLPVHGSLRTRKITFPRPERLTRGGAIGCGRERVQSLTRRTG
jgi:site-specific DNA recombinase